MTYHLQRCHVFTNFDLVGLNDTHKRYTQTMPKKASTNSRKKTAQRAAKKKTASKAVKRTKQSAKKAPPDPKEVSLLGWDTRRDPESWKPAFLHFLKKHPLNIGEVCRLIGISRGTYRRALTEDPAFMESFQDIQSDCLDDLKARAFNIARGQEDEIQFVGKDGRKEVVKKDGQHTLRWMLEGLEPQTFNQRSIEARGDKNIRDPIFIMPQMIEDPDSLEITHEISEDSVRAEDAPEVKE